MAIKEDTQLPEVLVENGQSVVENASDRLYLIALSEDQERALEIEGGLFGSEGVRKALSDFILSVESKRAPEKSGATDVPL